MAQNSNIAGELPLPQPCMRSGNWVDSWSPQMERIVTAPRSPTAQELYGKEAESLQFLKRGGK